MGAAGHPTIEGIPPQEGAESKDSAEMGEGVNCYCNIKIIIIKLYMYRVNTIIYKCS